MRDLIVLIVHLTTTLLRIARPGGLRSVIAESVLIKHQLLTVNRSRRRAPNLRGGRVAIIHLPVDLTPELLEDRLWSKLGPNRAVEQNGIKLAV